MGELYQHLHFELTQEQCGSYVRLARHLVVASQREDWDPTLFEMGTTGYDVLTGDHLEPEDVAGHVGPIINDPLGHGPLAGIAALPDEDWLAYQVRVLGAERDSPLEIWLLDREWRRTDNTPVGAAMRMMYVLDYGVPGDWAEILSGRKQSDYLANGFLWDRVGLVPPGSG